jgi:hypothetical protein
MILLTDGSVLVHNAYGAEWRRLTPDPQGNYSTGTWSSIIAMLNSRQFFASGVLRDGKVFAIGGEYSNAGSDTPLGEIFDPLTNTWSKLAKPAAFDFIHGDIPCSVLANGHVLLGCIDDARTAIWNAEHDNWREAGTAFGTTNPTKIGKTSEETWTMLRDGSVLTVEVSNPSAAEKYLPGDDIWVSASTTPQNLIETVMQEIGPAVLLPDGRVFAIGGSTHTALYTEPHHHKDPGSWVNGPEMKDASNNPLTAIDAPAALSPSGKVLFSAGQRHLEGVSGQNEYWSGPTLFFEYDPISNGIVPTPNQPSISGGTDTWTGRLMLLPNGQVLYTAEQNQIWVYTPDGAPHHDWRPRITEHPHHLHRDESYELKGHRFNGLSQAVSYGDDYTAATNYPLVRLRKGAKVSYCRTHGFSTYAVATGDRDVHTRFFVPPSAPTGDCELAVVANGIASESVHVHIV